MISPFSREFSREFGVAAVVKHVTASGSARLRSGTVLFSSPFVAKRAGKVVGASAAVGARGAVSAVATVVVVIQPGQRIFSATFSHEFA